MGEQKQREEALKAAEKKRLEEENRKTPEQIKKEKEAAAEKAVSQQYLPIVHATIVPGLISHEMDTNAVATPVTSTKNSTFAARLADLAENIGQVFEPEMK